MGQVCKEDFNWTQVFEDKEGFNNNDDYYIYCLRDKGRGNGKRTSRGFFFFGGGGGGGGPGWGGEGDGTKFHHPPIILV
jgi:hypothetical protein